MVQVCHYVIFRNKVGIPTTVGQGASSFRKNFSGNVLPRSYNASIQLNDHAKVTRHACMQVPNSCVVLYILQVLRTSLPFCPPFNGNSKLGERGGGCPPMQRFRVSRDHQTKTPNRKTLQSLPVPGNRGHRYEITHDPLYGWGRGYLHFHIVLGHQRQWQRYALTPKWP